MPISSDEELNAVILNDLKDIIDEVNLLIYDEVRTSIVDNVYSAYNSPNGWYERLEDRGGLLGSFTTEDAKIDGQTVEARTFHDPFGLFDSRAEMVNDSDNFIHGSDYWQHSKDRKSTRLTPVTLAHLVCRLLLEKKNVFLFQIGRAHV